MTVTVIVDLDDSHAIRRTLGESLPHARKDALNAAALAVTMDARRRVQQAVGPEQRLSGVRYRYRDRLGRDVKGGRRRRVSAEVRGKGGTRVNPAYKEAEALENPTALLGARGPAHFIEHPRVGGYRVNALFPDTWRGPAGGRQVRRGTRIATPRGPFMAVTVGPIRVPKAPITKAFAVASRTVEKAAAAEVEASIRRNAKEVAGPRFGSLLADLGV